MILRRLTLLSSALAILACGDATAPDGHGDPAYRLTVVSGDAQVGPIGLPLPDSLTVRVVDRDGRPAPGVDVSWRVLEGAGEVSSGYVTTDSDGTARVRWTLGEDLGLNLVAASLDGTPSATFRAEGRLYFVSVTAGWRHSCGLDVIGNAYCWGDNQWGQLGDGTRHARGEPVRVAGGGVRFASVFAGWLSTCGLAEDGRTLCWGDNDLGQIGAGSTVRALVPTTVLGDLRFSRLSLGYVHTCGIADGALYCWGSNDNGQLGGSAPGTCALGAQAVPCALQPLRVALPGAVSDAAAGEFHSCAATVDAGTYCWGDNQWGELGIGRFGGAQPSPMKVNGDTRFLQIVASSRNTCGLASDGSAYCWGMNSAGELGVGSLSNLAEPGRVLSDERFVRIGLGDVHACGLTESGAAYCWGEILGSGTAGTSLTPVAVAGGQRFGSLSVGGAHTCAKGGGIWCWGENRYGQLTSVLGPGLVLAPGLILPAHTPVRSTGSGG